MTSAPARSTRRTTALAVLALVTASTANAVYSAANAAHGDAVVNNRFVGVTGNGVSGYSNITRIEDNLFAESGWGVRHDGTLTTGSLVARNVFRKLNYTISSNTHDTRFEDNVVTGIRQRGLTLYGYNLTISGNARAPRAPQRSQPRAPTRAASRSSRTRPAGLRSRRSPTRPRCRTRRRSPRRRRRRS